MNIDPARNTREQNKTIVLYLGLFSEAVMLSLGHWVGAVILANVLFLLAWSR